MAGHAPVVVFSVQGVQFEDHPPNLTPDSAGALRITVELLGYVASHTDPPTDSCWFVPPQLRTSSGSVQLLVAEGAWTSQFAWSRPVLTELASKTVSVDNRPFPIVRGLHVPMVRMSLKSVVVVVTVPMVTVVVP